jgi:regulator of sirC expression with transglutaminase-like and TPR domain
VDASARFVELVHRPEPEIRLDEAALLVAAHARPDLDVSAELDRLDLLADTCFAPTLDALCRHLFVDLGFAGDRDSYHDPRNSYLNEVISRRRGIPITLSVLTIEVGRRLGVPLAAVGMPGHFLLRDRVDPEVFVDPFSRGAILDRHAVRRVFHVIHGDEVPFDESFLEPVGPLATVARILANLKMIFAARADVDALRWVVDLRAALPGMPAGDRRELAEVLVATGRFGDAADELDRLAVGLADDAGERVRTQAAQLRARLN